MQDVDDELHWRRTVVVDGNANQIGLGLNIAHDHLVLVSPFLRGF
jgi:hypothetical protein